MKITAQEKILKFDHYTVNDGLPQSTIQSITKDKYGFMWFGTWAGLVKFDGYVYKIYRSGEKNRAAGLSDNKILATVTDSMQNVWVWTAKTNYISKYNYEADNFERYLYSDAPDEVKRKIVQQRDRANVEVSNDKFKWRFELNKLVQTNLLTGEIYFYKPEPNNPFSLNDSQINCLYLDDHENLWIATQNGGVNHANLKIKPFVNYLKDKNGKSLADPVVRAICKDKQNRLWIGSEGSGITIIEKTPSGNVYKYIGRENFPNAEIRSLLCDKSGNIWIGTKGGLFQYNNQSQKLTQIKGVEINVFSLFEDKTGLVWIGTFGGLYTFDPTNKRLGHLNPENTSGGKEIRAIIEDRNQNLWIATEDKGLTKMISKGKDNYETKRYIHNDENPNSLANDHVYSIVEGGNSQIWAATNGGISVINESTDKIQNITSANGLPDNSIMGLLFDGENSIWVSHKKGLTRINSKSLEMKNFNMHDGLQGMEFCQSSCFHDPATGEFYFGGTNGMNSFFPDKIHINNVKPKAVFTKLTVANQTIEPETKINNRLILGKSIVCAKKLTLTWWDKTFSLEFSALHYANPQGNKYKYRLVGYDKDWIQVDASRRTVWYSNLSSGNYRFEVFAANSDGVWSDSPAVLDITILPPWWFTWWAIGFYVLVGFLIALFVLKYIASKLELKKNEEIHQAKLKFFTEVSHEFRTPLTLIIDPLDKIIGGQLTMDVIRQYSIVMQRNAKHLLTLINQLLDFRKLESGQLTLKIQKTDIVNFARVLASSFNVIAEQRNIKFEVISDVESFDLGFDSSKINMVLNNLISNAFKFTPDGGMIILKIEKAAKTPESILISVSDSGKGISKEDQSRVFDMFYQSSKNTSWQAGSGIGLALTKELVLLHNGTITVQSEVGKGACFSVFLPVNENVTADSEDEDTIVDTVYLEEPENHFEEHVSSDLPLLLVVDDNADIRNYIEMNLSSSYRVVKAPNGSKGLETAMEIIPDIIISDVMMPEMDGLEMCRRLKLDERTSHIPVILLTARQSDESRVEGYETGADAYLTKPFSSVVLQAQVQNLLDQRQRLRELFQKGTDIEIKKISINAADEAFLNKVMQHIYNNLEDEEFNINALAELLNMSRSQFYRKIKALTNQSLLDFVTTIRMNKALEYLISGDFNITETAYKVGYSMSSNFTRTFTRHFGTSPSKYIESIKG
ncbi:MAG: two-component regulator propeller domain-containing protein [Bacteroidales bacterium]|nr:two-component regulator propeller domain-containing protein [Bacteroidales bacterium]